MSIYSQKLLHVTAESFYHFTNRVAGRFCCFTGGFVDTVGFLLLQGVFAGSVTGNIVKFSISAADGTFYRLCVCVMIGYGAGSFSVRVMAHYLSYLKIDSDLIGASVFILEIILLILTIFVCKNFETSLDSTSNNQSADIYSKNDNYGVLICGVVMALPMGVQYAAAPTAFPQFTNTTGMTASVATSFSAIANVCLVYMSDFGLIHFYLSEEEQKELESLKQEKPEVLATERKELYDLKKECALDELDRQLNPLIYFTVGCIASTPAAKKMGFNCLWIPVGVISFLVFEIYLARSSRGICNLLEKNKVVQVHNHNDTSSKNSDRKNDEESDIKDRDDKDDEDDEDDEEEDQFPSTLSNKTDENVKPSLVLQQARGQVPISNPRYSTIVRRTSITGAPISTAPKNASRSQR